MRRKGARSEQDAGEQTVAEIRALLKEYEDGREAQDVGKIRGATARMLRVAGEQQVRSLAAMEPEVLRTLRFSINWGALLFEVAKVIVGAVAQSFDGGDFVKAETPARKGARRKASKRKA